MADDVRDDDRIGHKIDLDVGANDDFAKPICNEHHAHTSDCGVPAGLTKNETFVWETLSASDEPLKAYEILDHLKTKGVRAPMTVYRALDGLEDKGLIHKLEGLNSFMVCNHAGPHTVQVFLMCGSCPSVQEIGPEGLEILSSPAIRNTNFRVGQARLEVRGTCAACAAK